MFGRASGYSLLEVLIVVAIIGMIATLAAPPFLRMIEQQSEIAQIAEAERTLSGLPMQARERRKDIVLRPRGASETAIPRPPYATPLADPEIADISALPEGWRIEPAQDIWVRYDGVCYGGDVTLVNPLGRRFDYTLEPPFCTPRRHDLETAAG